MSYLGNSEISKVQEATVDVDKNRDGMVALVAAFILLTTFTTVMRFVVRKMQKSAFGIDDFCIIPAWLCFVGITALMIYGMLNNIIASPMWGHESSDLILKAWSRYRQVYWITNLLATVVLGFTRLCALFYYRRIFVTKTKLSAFGIMTIVTIVVVCLWTVSLISIAAAVCDNPAAHQAVTICFYGWYAVYFAATSFILDLLVVLLPIPVIWGLHTTIGRKLGITAVFLLATAGIAASCLRVVISVRSIVLSAVPNSMNYTLVIISQILYYLVMEVGLALVAVNLPTLWYLCKGVTSERILGNIRSLIGLRSSQSPTKDPVGKSHELEWRDPSIVVTQDYEVNFEPYTKDREESNV